MDKQKDAQKKWFNDNSARCGLNLVDENNETHYRRLKSLLPAGEKLAPALEIGCGGGWYYEKFKPAVGIDLSINSIKESPASMNVLAADAENLPFKDGSFNFVYGFAILHHLSDIEKGLHEAYRVLKPGGTVAFGSENNAACPMNYVFPLLYGNWEVEKGFIRISKKNITNILKRIGFTDFQHRIDGFAVYGLTKTIYKITKRIEHSLIFKSNLIRQFAGCIYFGARKPN